MRGFSDLVAHRDPPLTAEQAKRMHTELADVLSRYGRSVDARMHRRLAVTFEAVAIKERAS